MRQGRALRICRLPSSGGLQGIKSRAIVESSLDEELGHDDGVAVGAVAAEDVAY